MGTVEYQFTLSEYTRTAFKRYLRRQTLTISLTILVVLMSLGFGILDHRFILVALIVPLLVVTQFVCSYLKIKSTIASAKALTNRQLLEFDDTGIKVTGDGVVNQFAWTIVYSWSKDQDYIYLNFDSSGTALLIPKRTFDAENLNQFEKHLAKVKRDVL